MAPGSNRWPDFTRRPEPAEMTTAEMKPGSGMIYTGRTIHGAGGNVAESSERAQQLLGLAVLLGGWAGLHPAVDRRLRRRSPGAGSARVREPGRSDLKSANVGPRPHVRRAPNRLVRITSSWPAQPSSWLVQPSSWLVQPSLRGLPSWLAQPSWLEPPSSLAQPSWLEPPSSLAQPSSLVQPSWLVQPSSWLEPPSSLVQPSWLVQPSLRGLPSWPGLSLLLPILFLSRFFLDYFFLAGLSAALSVELAVNFIVFDALIFTSAPV